MVVVVGDIFGGGSGGEEGGAWGLGFECRLHCGGAWGWGFREGIRVFEEAWGVLICFVLFV